MMDEASIQLPRQFSQDPETGRRRSTTSRLATLAATTTLLEEVGFDKLSIERIAAKAGVGKATIYRWWPNKGALAMEAFLNSVAPTISFPATESTAADLLVQIRRLALAYRGKAGQIVREMIGLGQFDEETMRLFVDGYLEPRRSAARSVLQRGIENGEFKDDVDTEVVIDAFYGPVFHRMLTGHATIDEAFIDAHAKLILSTIATE